jgi:hypothetical protein
MKSELDMGDVKSRIMKLLVLSFAITIPEKRDMNASPKTAIPGVSWSIEKSSTGTLD